MPKLTSCISRKSYSCPLVKTEIYVLCPKFMRRYHTLYCVYTHTGSPFLYEEQKARELLVACLWNCWLLKTTRREKNEDEKKMLKERRWLWKLAVNMKVIVTEERYDHTLVCSKDFCSGKFIFYPTTNVECLFQFFVLFYPNDGLPLLTEIF